MEMSVAKIEQGKAYVLSYYKTNEYHVRCVRG